MTQVPKIYRCNNIYNILSLGYRIAQVNTAQRVAKQKTRSFVDSLNMQILKNLTLLSQDM